MNRFFSILLRYVLAGVMTGSPVGEFSMKPQVRGWTNASGAE
jgi:hypothetical protein